MSSLGIIPNFYKNFVKWDFCNMKNITKTSHESVERNFEILDLIHSNSCKFEGILTQNGIKYFITFIDNF